MSQLSRLENEHQEILDELHERSTTSSSNPKFEVLLDQINEVVKDWDKLFAGDLANRAVGEKVKQIEKDDYQKDEIRELDIFLDPLRHYVIALEKYKIEEFRDVVTRTGMVVERVILEVAIELGNPEIAEQKTTDALGQLQSRLESSGINRSSEFCNDMRSIYTIRNDRGPHDVPAAEKIHAKRCVSSLMWVYYRYLGIVSEIGKNKLSQNDIMNFTNLLDGILEFKPSLVVGASGSDPSVKDVLVEDLYKSGFFKEGQSLADVIKKLSDKRYNFPKSTVARNLRKLNNDVLRRRGDRGSYEYIEKIPPKEYFQ